jgi:hypothetical protein
MKRWALAALLLSAACGAVRWSGGAASDAPAGNGHELAVSTAAARPRTPAAPPSTAAQLATAEFYSDLGPEEVDVSAYPAQQRHNYRIYASACARCHSLARSINAPMVDRRWWEFYMLSMRVRGRISGRRLSKQEVEAVLDFLEYDGRERKVARAKEFESLTVELKARYEAALDARMRALQGPGQPALVR